MDMGKIYLKTAILKRFYPIIIVAFFLLNASMITPISQTATATEYLGVGNWEIEDNTTVTGETIVVYGNVIVKDGGSLTLDHCTLKIESVVSGNNGIEVEAGGELYVYDTTITSNGELQYYSFKVYGKLMIDGADISKMFWLGLEVRETEDAIIKNSKVHDNELSRYGILFANSTGEIIECNIYKNYRGIETIGNSIVNITNNIITSNNNVGIFCAENSKVNINSNTISDTYGGRGRGIEIQGNSIVNITNNIITSNMQIGIICGENSKVNINSNTISDTYGERGRGIDIQDNSTVNITNNIITSNMQVGIFCEDNSKVNIDKNVISKTGGGFRDGPGIYADDFCTVHINNTELYLNEKGITILDLADVKVYNSSITDSIEYDIYVDNSSHPTIINTIFSLDELFFNDTKSIISIGYWVDVNVQNKNNVPVQNARVAVMNNNGAEVFNGTSDYDGHCLAPVVEYDLDYTFTKKEWTPHTVYASKLGQSASEEIIVDMNRVVNFTLDVSDKLARGNLITQIVEGHEVSVEYSGNGTVSIEPAAKPAEIPNATKDIGIFVNINAVGNVEDLYITIRYSDNELGKVNEANLRMYCYFGPGDFGPGDFGPGDFDFLGPGNFTGGWVKIKDSGVDTYGNVVWAKVSHLTIFAPMAEEVAKPVSRGNIWYLYGGAGVTSLAVLWIVFFITFRKRIFHKSKTGK